MLFSGSCICSNRVLATCAIHSLKGSALGEGMDCIRRNSCSVSATSVRRSLPSAARNFNRLQVVTVWLPSFINLCFNTFQRHLTKSSNLNILKSTVYCIVLYYTILSLCPYFASKAASISARLFSRIRLLLSVFVVCSMC